MPYEKTAAYKTGAISLDGKTTMPVSDMTPEQKESYTIFHRLVFNIRRLLSKVPIVGKSILTNYATAILMLKEETGISESVILDVIQEFTNNEINEESKTSVELIPRCRYQLAHDMIHHQTGEILFREGTDVIVSNKSEQSSVFGIQFFEAIHLKTNQTLIICEGDVTASPTNTVELIPPRETKDTLFIRRKKKKKRRKNENIQ
jgi:hypothetical protein